MKFSWIKAFVVTLMIVGVLHFSNVNAQVPDGVVCANGICTQQTAVAIPQPVAPAPVSPVGCAGTANAGCAGSANVGCAGRSEFVGPVRRFIRRRPVRSFLQYRASRIAARANAGCS